jgi:hypothetical protein
MIKGILYFFKCCKTKSKPNEEQDEDIRIVNNNTEIRKILNNYNIEESNFNTIEEEKLIEREIKNDKKDKKDNDTIISIENGDKRVVDIDANKIKDKDIEFGIEIFKSYEVENKDINLYINKSKEEAKLLINNSSSVSVSLNNNMNMCLINIRDNIVLEFTENDPNKILVPSNYIRDDEKDHIIFVL